MARGTLTGQQLSAQIQNEIQKRYKAAFPRISDAQSSEFNKVLDIIAKGMNDFYGHEWRDLVKSLVTSDKGYMDDFLQNHANPPVIAAFKKWINEQITLSTFLHSVAASYRGYKNFILNWAKTSLGTLEGYAFVKNLNLIQGNILEVYKTHIIKKREETEEHGTYGEFLETKPSWVTRYSRKAEKFLEEKPDIQTAQELLQEVYDEALNDYVRDPSELIRNGFLIASTLGMTAAYESFTGRKRTAIFMGPMPLTHIKSIEIGHSGKILKWRAVGSVFLAQQKGGRDTVKIRGIIHGFEKVFVFYILWGLFIYGKGFHKMMPKFDPLGTSSLETIRSTVGDMSAVYNRKLESPTHEAHLVFPIVTQHEIVPNCYIETFSFEETIEGGKETIHYDLLCRTYERPKGFERFKVSNNNYQIKMKRTTRLHTVMNYAINKVWRHIRYKQETGKLWILDTLNPATKNAYDVDPLDMAASYVAGLALPSIFKVW